MTIGSLESPTRELGVNIRLLWLLRRGEGEVQPVVSQGGPPVPWAGLGVRVGVR